MPRPIASTLPPRRREGTAEIVILPCVRRERLVAAPSIVSAEAS